MFDPNQFDPSKLDPKVLMELTQLIRQLPPEKISRMQSLMHNMMAGHDVTREMEEFERSLPPGFREKIVAAMAGSGMGFPGMGMGMPGMGGGIPNAAPITGLGSEPEPSSVPDEKMDLHGARLTILRGVANGNLSPEEAERLLFPTSA